MGCSSGKAQASQPATPAAAEQSTVLTEQPVQDVKPSEQAVQEVKAAEQPAAIPGAAEAPATEPEASSKVEEQQEVQAVEAPLMPATGAGTVAGVEGKSSSPKVQEVKTAEQTAAIPGAAEADESGVDVKVLKDEVDVTIAGAGARMEVEVLKDELDVTIEGESAGVTCSCFDQASSPKAQEQSEAKSEAEKDVSSIAEPVLWKADAACVEVKVLKDEVDVTIEGESAGVTCACFGK